MIFNKIFILEKLGHWVVSSQLFPPESLHFFVCGRLEVIHKVIGSLPLVELHQFINSLLQCTLFLHSLQVEEFHFFYSRNVSLGNIEGTKRHGPPHEDTAILGIRVRDLQAIYHSYHTNGIPFI